VPLAESETSWCNPAPTRRDAREIRRTTSQAPSAASSSDTSRAIKITNESWAERNISCTLISTVVATATTGSSVAIVSCWRSER
jgi:hypothetical protein